HVMPLLLTTGLRLGLDAPVAVIDVEAEVLVVVPVRSVANPDVAGVDRRTLNRVDRAAVLPYPDTSTLPRTDVVGQVVLERPDALRVIDPEEARVVVSALDLGGHAADALGLHRRHGEVQPEAGVAVPVAITSRPHRQALVV